MKKKIWITALAAGWVILIGVLCSFGHKSQITKHRAEAFNQGVNNVINSVIMQIQTQGEITITTNQGSITLVKKETRPGG